MVEIQNVSAPTVVRPKAIVADVQVSREHDVVVNTRNYVLSSASMNTIINNVNVPDWLKIAIDAQIAAASGNVDNLINELSMFVQALSIGVAQQISAVQTDYESRYNLTTQVVAKLNEDIAAYVATATSMVDSTQATALFLSLLTSQFDTPTSDANAWVVSSTQTMANDIIAIGTDLDILTVSYNGISPKLTSLDILTAGAYSEWDGISTPTVGQFKKIGTIYYQYLGGTLGTLNDGWVLSTAAQSISWSGYSSKLITGPDGSITGWSFGDGSNINSNFKINAQNFSISDGVTGYTPFEIIGSQINFNGSVSINKLASSLFIGEYTSAPSTTVTIGTILYTIKIGDTYKNTTNGIVYQKTSTGWTSTQGLTGTNGTDGTNGARGAISAFATYTTLTPTATQLADTINQIANPDGCIVGDNVQYTVSTGGTRMAYCTAAGNPGTWTTNVTLYVHGNAVIDGSIVANKLDIGGDYLGTYYKVHVTGNMYASGNMRATLFHGWTNNANAAGYFWNETTSGTASGVTAVSKYKTAIYCYTNNTANEWGVWTYSKIHATAGYSPFTGAHMGLGLPQDITQVGDIVIAYDAYGEEISQATAYVKSSETVQDKKVFGVIESVASWDKYLAERGNSPLAHKEFYTTLDSEQYKRVSVNALGEGMINVCNENGNIEAGDYICTSNVRGKGMKQNDDLMHSYTVAKALENVQWTDEVIGQNGCYEINSYKVKMICCTYHCG